VITSRGPGNSVDIINVKTGQTARVQPVSKHSGNGNSGNSTTVYLKKELNEEQKRANELQDRLSRVLAAM
jgi:hypothetical protein